MSRLTPRDRLFKRGSGFFALNLQIRLSGARVSAELRGKRLRKREKKEPKCVQVKEFMLPGQHKLGKHRPAKPFGKDESASLFRGKRCLLFLISPKKGKKAHQRKQELCWPVKK